MALGKTRSDASDLLQDVGFSPCLEYDDEEGIKLFIQAAYKDYKSGIVRYANYNIKKYHRQTLTKTLAACLDEL